MTIPLLPILAIAVSAVQAALAGRAFVFGRASMRWPRVEGTVVDLYFDESDMEGDDDATFSAHLTFVYTVRGRRYRATRFTYRPTRGLGQRHAYAMLQGLRQGQKVDVHHDPQHPERAVVLPGIDGNNVLWLWFWALALCASLGWLLVG